MELTKEELELVKIKREEISQLKEKHQKQEKRGDKNVSWKNGLFLLFNFQSHVAKVGT